MIDGYESADGKASPSAVPVPVWSDQQPPGPHHITHLSRYVIGIGWYGRCEFAIAVLRERRERKMRGETRGGIGRTVVSLRYAHMRATKCKKKDFTV